MNYSLIFALLFNFVSLNLPVDNCQNLYADLKKGTLNKVNAAAEMEEVKSKFTCFTGESKEGEFYNCGGGVFFKKHQFYFYTHRDYIEIRDGFPGKFSHKVMGVGKEALISLMGNADKIETYGGNEYLQFKRKWGVLVFVLTNDNVKKIQFHHKKEIGKIEFCY
jgi:hypothetical protein